VAFDVNQSPFALYRFLPREFSGAQKKREFKAMEFPFLTSREIFCALGGFSPALHDRFEDLDFCLTANRSGIRALYTPQSVIVRRGVSWQPNAEQDQLNRIRFYSKWAGALWQDEQNYLKEDGLTHDALTAIYRDFAARLADGVNKAAVFAAP